MPVIATATAGNADVELGREGVAARRPGIDDQRASEEDDQRDDEWESHLAAVASFGCGSRACGARKLFGRRGFAHRALNVSGRGRGATSSTERITFGSGGGQRRWW